MISFPNFKRKGKYHKRKSKLIASLKRSENMISFAGDQEGDLIYFIVKPIN